MIYQINTLGDTAKLARKIAKQYLDHGGLITLSGPLGAGKTTFTQSFARALGIRNRITSPTFILSRQYLVPQSSVTLHHLDLYRLVSSVDLLSINLNELLQDPNNLIIIEWPEKISGYQNLPGLHLKFELLPDSSRQITANKT